MPKLTESLQQWPSADFNTTFKRELENLAAGTLPLDTATLQCGMVDDSDISVTIISTDQDETCIRAKVAVFFTEIVAGCVCGDEPTAENAHCEMLIRIDKSSAEVEFELISA